MSTKLADADARDRIAEDLETTLFVEAAAGTGKTTQLVNRMISLVRSGRGQLEGMVAVTFTEAAAGELKLRLREEIEACRNDDAAEAIEKDRFAAALEQLEIAHIGTIHGFCGDVLREYPIEAGIDPSFEVAPEDTSRGLQDRAFDDWFQQILDDPPPGVRRALRRKPFRAGEAPSGSLRSAVSALCEHRDFPAPWTQVDFDREAVLDGVIERMTEMAVLAADAYRPQAYLTRHFSDVARFIEEIEVRERATDVRDYDGIEASLSGLARARGWGYKGHGDAFGREMTMKDALALRDRAKAAIDAFLADAEADLATSLHAELRPVVEAYESLKMREGRLDFLDLLARTRDLIASDEDVRSDLQTRFTHFFVDEFQDTDPLQAEILLLLSSGDRSVEDASRVTPVPGKLFLVGDPKQSIYRFRRADVSLYERTKRQLVEAGAEVVYLSTSFRSLPSIQDAVNAAFAPHMRGAEDGHQADYVALEPFREEPGDQPSVVALPVPRPYSQFGRLTMNAITASYPDAVGAFVHWLVESSGWTVGDGEDRRPVVASDVCILFRRFQSYFQDVTRPYVRALEARRISHVLVGGRSFYEREEVLALRNALSAIEWPDDTLRVYATLRGPLFGFGDDVLLAFRHFTKGSFHPLRSYALDEMDESLHEVVEALAILGRLHGSRNRRPISHTISLLLEAVRAHAGIAIGAAGDQALANTMRLIERAHRFERRGASSFRAFVELLEDEAERGLAEEAALVEEGTEGVRVMTAHKAKGLEFPVVILADPMCRATRDPSRYTDAEKRLWAEKLCGAAPRDLLDHADVERERDEAEAIRVAYVAATRTRDLLVVPTVGDDEMHGWLEVLNPIVYPQAAQKREAVKAPGCPPFGPDSVRLRPKHPSLEDATSVAPGLHRPALGAHHVVWWDPNVLDLDRQPRVGLRHQKILEASEEGSADREDAYAKWRSARAEVIERSAAPAFKVSSVTERAALAETWQNRVRVEKLSADRTGRPSGARFGALVHATLAVVPLAADEEEVRRSVDAHGRQFGSTAEEKLAATTVVTEALEHPDVLRASTASSVRREAPLQYVEEDGTVIEGYVDLAYLDDNRWVVVDFKTDAVIGDRELVYTAQVAHYCRGIEEAMGCEAEGVLLVV